MVNSSNSPEMCEAPELPRVVALVASPLNTISDAEHGLAPASRFVKPINTIRALAREAYNAMIVPK
jgi:hypothetical protein